MIYILRIPCQESKNETGIVISIFAIQINTNHFMTSLLASKLYKAMTTTASAILKNFFILKKTQSFTGYLSFCASIVKLGWVFMRHLWLYIAQFLLSE